MKLKDFFSPLKRHELLFFILIILLSGSIFGIIKLLPKSEKTTIYFSIKPAQTTQQNTLTNLDPTESSMKIADMIAGWAKNPAFREDILKDSDIFINHFKEKITARKQNRTNVFWTISLDMEEKKYSKKIAQSTINVFEKNFEEFNQNNAFPFEHTRPQVFRELKTIPFYWSLFGSAFFGLILSFYILYLFESILGKVSFISQIRESFPHSPLLKISEKTGTHDEKLLEQFILTFASPRLIGTFPKAEEIFSLTEKNAIDKSVDTPILLIQLGKTTIQELENLEAIFGKELGIVVFEK
ncbi:hypothetical protein KAI58_04955 [Candidatus Gracilibacteria bacterium]|nr:hypothetical protein [Candidatus Gracilibacteria bacterium]